MILYVEDDADDRELFRIVLSANFDNVGYREAINGQECIRLLDSSSTLPKLIVADINMPLMNGYELMRKLKKDDRYKSIPIIAFSTAGREAEKMAIKMGADKFYTKPADFHEFQQLLRTIVTDFVA